MYALYTSYILVNVIYFGKQLHFGKVFHTVSSVPVSISALLTYIEETAWFKTILPGTGSCVTTSIALAIPL